MDALEFVNEFKRMCNQSSDDCSDCPLDKIGCSITMMDDGSRKNLVEEVEKWSKAHQKKTRQSEFLKLYPNAPLSRQDGFLVLGPCMIAPEFYKKRFEEFSCLEGDCKECREHYWLQEVE